MNSLIPIEKRLKEIQKLVQGDQPPIFPHIVLVGAQGAGKTSVLEKLIGFQLFPRGATRCPVIVHMKNIERGHVVFKLADTKYTESNDVLAAFEKEVENNAGKNFNISSKPILMEITATHFVDLTLIDLPGISQVASNVANQIKTLSLRYMKNPNSIILVVVPANSIENESLKLARTVDNMGCRTIVIVNKLDTIMDITSALGREELSGFYKTIGVIAKPSKEKRKFEDSLKKEKKFLNLKFPNSSRDHGIRALQVALANVLREYLKINFRDYRIALSNAVAKTERNLQALGTPCGEPGKVIIEEVTRYAAVFRSLLNGNWEIDTVSLVGGARIGYIFREIFNPTIDAQNPLNGLSRSEILTALRNSCGTRPEISFIPESCFEGLARRQVNLLSGPCRECVDLVMNQMLQLSKDAANPLMIQRFPILYTAIFKVTTELIQKRYQACCEFVEDLLTMELGYIYTPDIDFQKEVDAGKMKWLTDRGYLESGNSIKRNSENSTRWFSVFLNRKDGGDTSPTAPLDQTSGVIRVSEQEDANSEILETLLVFYINIVRKSLKNRIPKAIMLRLVNYVNDNLYSELLESLQREKLNERDLLIEPQEIVQQRDDLTAFYKNLQNLENNLGEIQDQLRKTIT